MKSHEEDEEIEEQHSGVGIEDDGIGQEVATGKEGKDQQRDSRQPREKVEDKKELQTPKEEMEDSKNWNER
jgi:hypothetical protein